jgi:Zn-dependent protease
VKKYQLAHVGRVMTPAYTASDVEYAGRPGMSSVLPVDGMTAGARRVLDTAAEVASARHSPTLEPEDLLLAVLATGDGVAQDALRYLEVTPATLVAELKGRVPHGEATSSPVPSPHARQVVVEAIKEAQMLGHRQVDAFHLLLALTYAGGIAGEVLNGAGISMVELREFVQGRGKVLSMDDARATRPARHLERPPMPSLSVIRPSPAFLLPVGAMALGGVGLWMEAPDILTFPLMLLFVVGGWITSVCVHEFGHALVAYIGGDHSVAHNGYLSLNPLKYSHPMLSIGLPLLFILLGGIGLPGGAVYIDRRALRSPVWESFVSVAGPVGTLVFTLVVVAPFFLDWRVLVGPDNIDFWAALVVLAFFQVTSLVLNLIPLPPLDGFGIIAPWLGIGARMAAARYGNLVLMGLFLLLWVGGPVTQVFFGAVFTICRFFNIPVDELFLLGMRLFRPF